ncbi:hypothetical protein THRCLA_22511 [Thraustotheca clavata]|uniref:WRKY19-like zinc finger domain-containing protein n=1 Tax=Thraustotheca clavata TaxID=74557 RepID=A0A1V9YYI1_9STRA|nr:hypothetical protein THRCLA_22511 [Thraustotheca clavata]
MEPSTSIVSSLFEMKDNTIQTTTAVTSARLCKYPNCDKKVRSKGLCKAHGGGLRCMVVGCMRSSQGKGYCIRHGGGRRCSITGCNRSSQSNGLCKSHGGGLRCQVANCNKSSQGGGYCRMHGGGHRCQTPGCTKGAQRNGLCASHGGNRMCQFDGCKKNDRGGGYCAEHGGGRRCTVEDCSRPARKQGYCSVHIPSPALEVRLSNIITDDQDSMKFEQPSLLADIPQSAFEPYVDVYEQAKAGHFKMEQPTFEYHYGYDKSNDQYLYQQYQRPNNVYERNDTMSMAMMQQNLPTYQPTQAIFPTTSFQQVNRYEENYPYEQHHESHGMN